jgi:hypothetical protein
LIALEINARLAESLSRTCPMTDQNEIEVTQEMIEAGRVATKHDEATILCEEFGSFGEDDDFAAIYRAMHKKRPRAKRLNEILDVVYALHGETLRKLDG